MNFILIVKISDRLFTKDLQKKLAIGFSLERRLHYPKSPTAACFNSKIPHRIPVKFRGQSVRVSVRYDFSSTYSYWVL